MLIRLQGAANHLSSWKANKNIINGIWKRSLRQNIYDEAFLKGILFLLYNIKYKLN